MLAYVILDEQPSLLQIGGVALILVVVVYATRGRREPVGAPTQ
jgi:drug/metabolite transporter (DMT)-like permease